MITLPKLSALLFEHLHNSTWRLQDKEAQLQKAKDLAHRVLHLDRGDRNINESIDGFKSRWMTFSEAPKLERKTRLFRIYNHAPGELLGEIRWAGGIRAYSFFPAGGCVFSLHALADIQEFISLLMSERSEKAKFEKDKVLK